MTIKRIRNWVPLMGDSVESLADWVRRHYQDHMDESVARIEDLTNEKSTIELDDLAETSLSDPGADRIVFWDDSDTQFEFLVANTGLAIAVNNLNLSHLGIESLADAGADKILFWDDSETACKWLAPSTGLTITTTNLTTDDSAIDHDSLTNTHNLTTDIDHDATTNFVANEHIDHTSAIDNTNYVVKTPIRCKAYLGTDQDDIANATWVTVNLDTETFDTGSDFNTTTHQYTTPVAGYYMVCGSVYMHDLTADKRYGVAVYNVTDSKDEALAIYDVSDGTTTKTLPCVSISYIGASKALDLRAYQESGGALVDIGADALYTSMCIHLLST